LSKHNSSQQPKEGGIKSVTIKTSITSSSDAIDGGGPKLQTEDAGTTDDFDEGVIRKNMVYHSAHSHS